MVEDTNKQKKETHTSGNTESVTHSLNQENREENKKKSPSSYGYRGVIDIFITKDIDHKDWVIKELDKERGGIEFMLPNADGIIYLSWGDLYNVDITFVNTQKKYKEQVTLPTLELLIVELEEQRKRTVQRLALMLKDAFSGEAPEGKPF